MGTFLVWWLFTLALGMGFMPMTATLFSKYEDRGWLFSKVLGLATSGFLTWAIVCMGLLPFKALTCTMVTLLCIAMNFLWLQHQSKKGIQPIPFDKEFLRKILLEEALFFGLFLMWTFFAGFRPAAYGTEKFMDFGFMAAMMRSETLPPEDLWYSGSKLNYYYGGQYYAVFMTKLTSTRIANTYNIMRTMIASYAFVLPFAIVKQVWIDSTKKVSDKLPKLGVWVGILAGAAVSLAGNMHYVIIGKIWPLFQKIGLAAVNENTYWFPNSTRYLGHYPAESDQTIHEFPSYSFILGDLHAHVVNIMFVLAVVGILYAWIQSTKKCEEAVGEFDGEKIKKDVLSPYIFILGFFIGIFQWTNYWDFLIYFVVTGAIIVYRQIILYGRNIKAIFAGTATQALIVYVIAFIVALPFTLQFKQMTVEGEGLVGIAFNHSIFRQWFTLWGLPLIIVITFIAMVLWEYTRERKKKLDKYNIFEHISKQDMFIIILSLCAIGLILIPEVVFVRDIYVATAARANTMFKLTYQAFMMLGMGMAYAIVKFMTSEIKKLKVIGIVGLVCLISTVGYLGNAVEGWFGNVLEIDRYVGPNATQFLETEAGFAEDATAIRWLQENIQGSPVVLEANGDSYTDYCRVSAMTGLPTIVGWYVHEWLWRSDTVILNERVADIETIYTTEDWDILENLIQEYRVEYIFVGKLEREKFENLNNERIRAVGEVVFEDGNTYIVKVDKNILDASMRRTG